jgi:hypothetical protein
MVSISSSFRLKLLNCLGDFVRKGEIDAPKPTPILSQPRAQLVQVPRSPGANVGRCRVIELQPNEYVDNSVQPAPDDNNRLKSRTAPAGCLRFFFNLTDDQRQLSVLRENRTDPSV